MERPFVLSSDLPFSYNHLSSFQNFHYPLSISPLSKILFQTKGLCGPSNTINAFQTYLSVPEQGTDCKYNMIHEIGL